MASKIVWSVVLALMALLVVSLRADDPYCTPKKGTPKKKIPDLDFKAFTVEYRGIIEDKNYTIWAKESYDQIHNMARMDILNGGLEQGLLIDYTNDTYILWGYLDTAKTNFKCAIEELGGVKSDNLDIFGFTAEKVSPGSKLIPKIVSAPLVLQLVNSFGEEYIDDDSEIDGLPVDHWQSCMTWDDDKATFTLDYYFTKEEFKPRDSLTPSQIPVRAEVRGVSEKDGKSWKFHHVYEYLDFRVFPELPLETFSIPEFMSCEGADSVWKKDFPSLPQSMTYTVEKVTHSSDGKVNIELATVHTDGKWRLIRVDQEGSTSISDFRTGVEYFIDDSGCEPRPIDPDNVPWAKKDNDVVKMKDRPEILYLKQEFSYTGYKKFRSILTHAFVAHQAKMQIEAYISTDGITPLGVKVTDLKDDVSTTYNIFNFDEFSSRSDENPFDVQRCKNTETMKDLTIELSASGYPYNLKYQVQTMARSLSDGLRDKAAEIAGVTPIQIVTKDISVQDRDILWLVRLLDGESNDVGTKVEDQLSAKSVTEIEMYLAEALYEGHFTYTIGSSYQALEFTGMRIINSFQLALLSVKSDIQYHYRLENGKCLKKHEEGAELSTKNSAQECAQACVDSQNVACNLFEYVSSTKACTLSWSQDIPELTDSNGCAVYRRRYLSYFTSGFGEVLMKDTGVVYKKADDSEACAKICIEEKSFHCESFDFCAEGKRCRVYDTHFYSNDANPKPGADFQACIHYSRAFFGDFQLSYGKTFDDEYAVKVEAENVVECSYLCAKDEDGCMAFSYCFSETVADVEKGLTCKLLPSSQTGKVTFKATDIGSCMLGVLGNKYGTGRSKTTSALPSKSGNNEGSKYSGGALFGLGVAMTTVGAGIAGLAYFLLRHFNVWRGF